MKTLAIIGGGASGMLAGITALETNPDIQVIIFDQKDILGKKILSTGNGRCNLTNKNMSLDYFRSDEPQLISSVLKAFGYSDTIRFFENLGLWSYVKKKYKLNVPNFHVPAGQVSLQEPQQILPLLSDILLRTD